MHVQMQSLTSCQCSVCLDCFTQHFTIKVRDGHIWDMVCPICRGPDITDPEQLDSYFFTLDIQVRPGKWGGGGVGGMQSDEEACTGGCGKGRYDLTGCVCFAAAGLSGA